MNSENAENFFKNYLERVKVHYGHHLIAWKKSSRQSNDHKIANSAKMIQFAGALGYKLRAFAHMGNGDLNNAISDFSAAIRDMPDVANLYEDRSAAYGEKGDFDRAIADLDKALQIKSDSADSYYYRSLAYLGKGNFDRAFADCDKALKLDFISSSGQLDAYLLRGFLYGRDGDLDKAIADFEAALRIKVENVGDNGAIEVESIFHGNAREYLEHARQAQANPEFVKRLKQEKIDKQYNELLSRKNTASTSEALTALAREFRAMNGYKDASALAEQCDSMAKELIKRLEQEKIYKQYNELLGIKKMASNYETLTALAREFRAMNGYKDTSALAEQCNSMAEESRSKKYQELLFQKEKASQEDNFKNLHENFLEMGDYENAKALAAECNEQYNKLKEQRKRREAEEAAQREAKKKKQQLIVFLAVGIAIAMLAAFIIYKQTIFQQNAQGTTRSNTSSATWTTRVDEEVVNKPEKVAVQEIEKPEANTFTDSRDMKTYKITKIGTQTWMAENLNYVREGKCYNDNPANCQKYGKLFSWADAKKICPVGWHLPSNVEWDALYKFVDGVHNTESPYKSETAGKQLKAASGWNPSKGKSGNGEDAYGFAALPGGSHYLVKYNHIGNAGYWWSASEYEEDSDKAYYRFALWESMVAGWNKNSKNLLLSVRCVRD